MTIMLICIAFVFSDYANFYWTKQNCSFFLDKKSIKKVESLNYISIFRPRIYLLLFFIAILIAVSLKRDGDQLAIVSVLLFSIMVAYCIIEMIWIGKTKKIDKN